MARAKSMMVVAFPRADLRLSRRLAHGATLITKSKLHCTACTKLVVDPDGVPAAVE